MGGLNLLFKKNSTKLLGKALHHFCLQEKEIHYSVSSQILGLYIFKFNVFSGCF